MNIHVGLTTDFESKLAAKTLNVGIIGLGYVGLPLAHAFWLAGVKVTGFDIDATKVEKLGRAESYINHFPSAQLEDMNSSGRFEATADFSALAGTDAILICVPTP